VNVMGASPASAAAESARHVAALLIAVAACCLLAAGQARAAGPEPASGTVDLAGLGDAGPLIKTPARDVGGRSTTGAGARTRVGDVNGDGFGDLAVGVPRADPAGRSDAGSVYVLFGGGDFRTPDLASLGIGGYRIGSRDPGYRIDGRDAGDRLGTSIVALGNDLGDSGSPADFAVGAPRATDGGPSRAGVVYLVPGSKARTGVVDLRDSADPAIIRLTGVADGDAAGQSLAVLDRSGGLVIGAPGADPPGLVDAGAVHVIASLARIPTTTSLSLAKATYRLDGVVPGGRAGTAVATSPDMDADGVEEVLVGAPRVGRDAGGTYAGEAYLAPPGTRPIVPVGGRLVIKGEPGSGLGASVAGMGDVSGDGKPDIAIGAPTASPGGRTAAGSAFIVFSSATGPAITATAAPGRVIRVDGVGRLDRLGSRLAGVRLDGDATGDLFVSAPGVNALGRDNAGAVYGLLGSALPVGIDLALLGRAGVRMVGAATDELAGADLSASTSDPPLVLVGGRTSTSVLEFPVVASAPAAIPPARIGNCLTSRDIELVVDDSRSLSNGDPLFLRRPAIDVMLGKPRSNPINLGAIEIGDRPMQVFPSLAIPTTGIGPGRELMTLRLLMAERIVNDGGVADYALGLAAGVVARPGATALLLITDGAAAPSAAPLPSYGRRVYVLQLGSAARARSASSLRALASSSGGQYFGDLDSETGPAALALIEADMNCEQVLTTKASQASAAEAPTLDLAPPATRNDNQDAIGALTLTPGKPTGTFATGLPLQTKTASLTLSFKPGVRTPRAGRNCVGTSPVSLGELRIFAGHTMIARAARGKVRNALRGQLTSFDGLRARGRCGPGFLVLRISGLEKLPGSGQAQAAANSPSRSFTIRPKLKKPSGRRRVGAGWTGRR
jgi:hypothetical protein